MEDVAEQVQDIGEGFAFLDEAVHAAEVVGGGSGEEDDWHLGVATFHLGREFDAGISAQQVIGDEGGDVGVGFEFTQGFGVGGGGDHVVAGLFQNGFSQGESGDFIVDAEEEVAGGTAVKT